MKRYPFLKDKWVPLSAKVVRLFGRSRLKVEQS